MVYSWILCITAVPVFSSTSSASSRPTTLVAPLGILTSIRRGVGNRIKLSTALINYLVTDGGQMWQKEDLRIVVSPSFTEANRTPVDNAQMMQSDRCDDR